MSSSSPSIRETRSVRKLLRDEAPARLVKDIVWLNAAVVITSLGSLLYQLAMSRSLSVAEYGLWNALLAMFVLLRIPGQTINLVVTRRVAELSVHHAYGEVRAYLLRVLRTVLPYLLGSLVLYALLTPLLLEVFRTSSLMPLLLLGVAAATSLIAPIGMAGLQGLQSFALLSLSTVLNTAAVAFVGVTLVAAGAGVSGAISGPALASVFTVVLSFLAIRWLLAHRTENSSLTNAEIAGRGRREGIWTTGLTYAVITGFLYLDILFARYFLSGGAAGEYASAAVLGKALFYGPSTVVTLMTPKVAAARGSRRSPTPYLYLGLALTGLLIAPVMALLWAWPSTIISSLFGDKYASAAASALLRRYTIATSLIAIAAFLCQYYLAQREIRFVYWPLAGLATSVIAMLLWHGSSLQLATALIAGSALATAGLFLMALIRGRTKIA